MNQHLKHHPRSLVTLVACCLFLVACQGPGQQPATGSTTVAANSAAGGPQAAGSSNPLLKPVPPLAGRPGPIGAPANPGPIPEPPPLSAGEGAISSGSRGAIISDHGAGLVGKVKMPSSLISNNGGSVISNNGAAIISNNGGAIISDNGAGIVANNTSRYHLAAASGPDGALRNAFLYLTNRDEKIFIDEERRRAFTATTDDVGSYFFAVGKRSNFPIGKDVVINAVLQGNLRLTGYVVPSIDGNRTQIDLASTLATEYLRGEAFASSRALQSYDQSLFEQAIALTRQAIQTGEIEAVRMQADGNGNQVPVGVFDLRIDHVTSLRNQYVTALAAVDAGQTLVRQLSEVWKQLIGYRPSVITTLAGNGAPPVVGNFLNEPTPLGFGRAYGGPASGLPAREVPVGPTFGVAVAARGDIFMTAIGSNGGSGYVRWIKTDGTVTSLWMPTYLMGQPVGIAVEVHPDATHRGTVLVVDHLVNRVIRLPIIDVNEVDGSFIDGNGQPLPAYRSELVAGQVAALTPLEALDPEHPLVVDASVAATAYPALDGQTAPSSTWRLYEEGDRRYVTTPAVAVENAARYANLNGPHSVAVDDEGHIYIADRGNHRVRMIPKRDGDYYGYRRPVDANLDGIIDNFSGPHGMLAGRIYTIAGNPTFDPARTPPDGSSWFGEFGGDGLIGQEAQLDQPLSVAFHGGSLYILDGDNLRVRRMSRATGVIETFAGNPQGGQQHRGGTEYDFAAGTAGDGGPAKLAQLSLSRAMTVDRLGRVIISDEGSGRLRMVDQQGIITTIAGRQANPLTGASVARNPLDGDALRWTDIFTVLGLAEDNQGNLLMTDADNQRLRKLWRQWD